MQVDAPAHILGIGLAALAPPGVAGVTRFGVQRAEHIHPAAAVEFVKPGALFGQKARVFEVALPVFQIDFAVGNVPVATDDDVALLGQQRLQQRVKGVEKHILERLPLFRRCARRYIDRDDREVAKVRADETAFGIEGGMPHAFDHAVGRGAAVDAYAAVAFFLGVMKKTVVARWRMHGGREVGRLGLEFLHAQHVGAIGL